MSVGGPSSYDQGNRQAVVYLRGIACQNWSNHFLSGLFPEFDINSPAAQMTNHTPGMWSKGL